jgi:hypothetical protein
MRYPKLTLLLLVGLTSSFQCASSMKNKTLQEPYQESSVDVSFSIDSLSVVDTRTSVDSGSMKIPRMVWKKRDGEIVPALGDEQKKVIAEEAARYARGSEGGKTVVVTLLEGRKRYHADFLFSKEYATTAVKVEVLDSVHQPYYLSATGNAAYEVESIKADNPFMEKLYQKALRNAVYKAFESFQTQERASKAAATK